MKTEQNADRGFTLADRIRAEAERMGTDVGAVILLARELAEDATVLRLEDLTGSQLRQVAKALGVSLLVGGEGPERDKVLWWPEAA